MFLFCGGLTTTASLIWLDAQKKMRWKFFRLDTCHLQCVERELFLCISRTHDYGDLDVALEVSGELPVDAAA